MEAWLAVQQLIVKGLILTNYRMKTMMPWSLKVDPSAGRIKQRLTRPLDVVLLLEHVGMGSQHPGDVVRALLGRLVVLVPRQLHNRPCRQEGILDLLQAIMATTAISHFMHMAFMRIWDRLAT
jgi:hypothetical protein